LRPKNLKRYLKIKLFFALHSSIYKLYFLVILNFRKHDLRNIYRKTVRTVPGQCFRILTAHLEVEKIEANKKTELFFYTLYYNSLNHEMIIFFFHKKTTEPHFMLAGEN
jgi:hypothetical protein